MSKKKPKKFNQKDLVRVINSWSLPFYDKRHDYNLYLVDDRARSNETRIDHIVKYSHDLKARDLELVPKGINDYFSYKKDSVYKNTYNYYILRKGEDKGFVKVSIRRSDNNPNYAWIKTIFITYKVK